MSKEVSSNELKGKEVIGPNGTVIGKVEDVRLDPNGWQVSSFEISLDRNTAEQIGIKKRFGKSEMPLKPSFVGEVGEKMLLKTSKDELVQYVTNLRVDETTKEIKIPP